MSLQDRKVKMFRCHIDPHIPPRAQQAFMMGDAQGQVPGEAHLTSIGVYVKVKIQTPAGLNCREFLVPLANLENIEFYPEEATVTEIKKKIGRPVGS